MKINGHINGLYRTAAGYRNYRKKNDQSESLLDSIQSAEAWGLEVGDGTLGSSSNFQVWKLVPSHFEFYFLMVFCKNVNFLEKCCWPDTINTESPKSGLD